VHAEDRPHGGRTPDRGDGDGEGGASLRVAVRIRAGDKKPFLYVVGCAAGVAGNVGKLITHAQERHWDVGVIATPQGLGFLDAEAIKSQTGYPIRSAWRTPGETRPLPPADAIAVAPATFNTINKWAAGISDTLALAILCESYQQSLEQLREMGVLIGSYEPHRPKAGGGEDRFCWTEAIDILESRLTQGT
jgi:hypothetical protein